MLGKRSEELAEWIKRDSQKLFEQIGKIDNTALECEIKVQKYELIVNELQAAENRNDEFLKKLLARAEQLEI